MRESIGFVGLGMMGSGMAANLLKHGYPLKGLVHRNRKTLENLASLGAS